MNTTEKIMLEAIFSNAPIKIFDGLNTPVHLPDNITDNRMFNPKFAYIFIGGGNPTSTDLERRWFVIKQEKK